MHLSKIDNRSNHLQISSRTVGVIVLSMLWGCASISVDWNYDPGADFSGLKTFDWAPEPQEKTGDPRIDNPLLGKNIRHVVENQLVTQGYQKSTTGSPDFWVSYHAAVKDEIDVAVIEEYQGYRSPGRWSHPGRPYRAPHEARVETRVEKYEYTEGTLILDIVDPAQKQLIWRGSAQSEIQQTASQEKKMEKLNKAVAKILSNFPPK